MDGIQSPCPPFRNSLIDKFVGAISAITGGLVRVGAVTAKFDGRDWQPEIFVSRIWAEKRTRIWRATVSEDARENQDFEHSMSWTHCTMSRKTGSGTFSHPVSLHDVHCLQFMVTPWALEA